MGFPLAGIQLPKLDFPLGGVQLPKMVFPLGVVSLLRSTLAEAELETWMPAITVKNLP